MSVIIGAIGFLIFCWLCTCCCLRWRRRRNLLERRKRIRYRLLHEDDDEENEGKKHKKSKKPSQIIHSESDYDLSDEQTLYDKPLLTAKFQTNSPSKKNRDLKVPVQDSNGSPMLRAHGQSPTTTDQSVA